MDKNVPLLTLSLDCETAVDLVTDHLTKNGMKVIRSFDLRSACASFTENVCPHHKTSPCNCQMVVLLVYNDSSFPASLVVHGHDTYTELKIVDSPDVQVEPELQGFIQSVLSGLAMNVFQVSGSSDVV